jgi:MoaA/NifB/PqqE/SkfB family radical SAM enzyme
MARIGLARLPSNIAIETTAHCNAQCIFCPLHGPKSEVKIKKGVMPVELFDSIMNQIKPRNDIKLIYLNIRGEPLIDPHFMIRMAKIKELDLGPKIYLQTNAQFLDMKKAAAMLGVNIGNVVIGFDGASKNVYEEHRINCDYDVVLSNIKQFVNLRNSVASATRVTIKYVLTQVNLHELEIARAMWQKILSHRLDQFSVNPSENWGSEKLDKSGTIIKTVSSSKKSISSCPMIHNFMNIFYDGNVGVCCWDYNLDIAGSMGNAKFSTLEDIWNGDAFRDFRERYRKFGPQSLARCSLCSQILKYKKKKYLG